MPDVRRECPTCGPTAPEPTCVQTTVVAGDALCVENECDHERSAEGGPDGLEASYCDEVTEHTICVTHAAFDRDGTVTNGAAWPCHASEASEKSSREADATHEPTQAGGDQ